MSEADVDVVRAIYERFRAGDNEGALALIDPEIEIHDRPEVPDPQVYRGHDGVRESLGVSEAEFEELDVVPEQLVAVADRVIVEIRFVGTGRGSGFPIDERLCHAWTIRDGKAVRMEVHSSRDDALRLTSRLATREDVPALVPLMQAAIDELQKGYLDEAQIRSSHAIMGIDNQLIDDGTYFVVECDGRLAGCGGWSRRATLYGGDHSAGRDSAVLDPSRDPAHVRAMYTHPDFTRRGVGRLILLRCESAAAAEGFTKLELMSTLAGAPLYSAAGYEVIEKVEDSTGGVAVPLVKMGKAIAGAR